MEAKIYHFREEILADYKDTVAGPLVGFGNLEDFYFGIFPDAILWDNVSGHKWIYNIDGYAVIPGGYFLGDLCLHNGAYEEYLSMRDEAFRKARRHRKDSRCVEYLKKLRSWYVNRAVTEGVKTKNVVFGIK